MAPKKTTRTTPLALAYIRVSTAEQAEHGASLEAQRNSLTAEAKRRGWDVEVVPDEGISAKSLKRPGLQSALARLDAADADYLLAIRIDRVSRSVADFAGLLDRSNQKGWGIVLTDTNIDTTTTAGRFTGNVLASAAQYERELIGDRTREGMAQRKAEGVHIGRPREIAQHTVEQISRLRGDGQSLAQIAETLTADGVPTAHGGAKWYASTVKQVLDRTPEGTQTIKAGT